MKRKMTLLFGSVVLSALLVGCQEQDVLTDDFKELIGEAEKVVEEVNKVVSDGNTESDNNFIDSPPAEVDNVEASVVLIKDGDTIVVDLEGETNVRLLLVNTPEVHGVDEPEPFGPEASAFAKKHLEGATVSLEFDEGRYDPYDRTLAYVYLPDGRMFNEMLIEEGLAEVVYYEPNEKYLDEFRQLEQVAKENRIGMWGSVE